MSRIRTGITPDAWREIGPETPHRSPRSYASVAVENVGNMRPVIREYRGINAKYQPKRETER